MRNLKLFLLIAVIASFIAGVVFHSLSEKGIDERLSLREIAPEIQFMEKTGNPPFYRSIDGIVAFNTYDIRPSIRGYAGPIKMLIALNSEGKIKGIKILEHRETKNYVHYMESPEYLRQFLDKSVHDQFRIDEDIDGISRATVSVDAMAKTIKESSRAVASAAFGIKVETEDAKEKINTGWIVYSAFFSICLIFYFITRKNRGLLWIRDIFLVCSIIIIGFYLSSPFSIIHIFNLIFFSLSSSSLWYTLVFSTIISVIIAGRFYCGWICPFGAIAEFIGKIPVKKWEIPVEIDDRWRDLKYIIISVISIIVFLSRRVDYGNYETYVTLFSFRGNFLTWGLVAISLLANLRIKRFWCRFLCPVAALTGVLSRKDIGYVSRNDCPMSNRPNPPISECIRCNRCYKKHH